MMRDGIVGILGRQDDMEVVAEAKDGLEAIDAFIQHRPDVTLMDLDLPQGAATMAIRDLLRLDPALCVIGLMTFEGDEVCAHALRMGARACVTKDRLNQDLTGLIQDCARRVD